MWYALRRPVGLLIVYANSTKDGERRASRFPFFDGYRKEYTMKDKRETILRILEAIYYIVSVAYIVITCVMLLSG